jgi:probable rRNA maturation factor
MRECANELPHRQRRPDFTGKRKSLVIFRKTIIALTTSSLERFVLRVRRLLNMRQRVNVLVGGSVELRSLNRRFRGVDKATDVLSFPSLPIGGRRPNSVAGEVVISADIARENAETLGHSLADEVRILTLHGILHLAGFDHENDRGEMAEKERRLRLRLGLETGLIERTGTIAAPRAVRGKSRKQPRSASRRSA